MTAKVLIVPGLNGSPADHWQSHIELSHRDTRRVTQADWDQPDLDVWLARLREAVRRNPGAVLVGHSLGCTLIAHLAKA
ncbi:RBBP9/YdeN family alpha/beta hydrolase, partial [Rhodoplanes sp. SY1]|uniref:RBBP9/YdeN family alpha/beta hydrolase n=1 Tax=Rhodoplanes sp. SY1 TaxID=3166646 RepID=UPI0038B66663